MGSIIGRPGQSALDYSFARPNLTAVKAAGYVGVFRYVGWDLTTVDIGDKIISVEEASEIWAAGLGLLLVFETTVQRPLAGAGAGNVDALVIIGFAKRLGYRGTLFTAVDFDANPESVRPYVETFCDTIRAAGYRPGIYGGVRVIEAFSMDDCVMWQATAWSGGRVASSTAIFQELGVLIPGTDINTLHKPVAFFHPEAPNEPGVAIPGKVDQMLFLVQLLEGAILLCDGFKARRLSDDGSEFHFYDGVLQLPRFIMVDEHINTTYKTMAGIAAA